MTEVGVKYIVSHAGEVHRDEFIAIAVTLAMEGMVSLFRRDPTLEELNDPKIYVIDVGMRYEPHLRNFDHHQHNLVEEAKKEGGFLEPAVYLVLDYFDLLRTAKEFATWMEFTARLDTTGPFHTAAWLGLTNDQFAATLSPIEAQVLRLVETHTSLTTGEVDQEIVELMKLLGDQWVSYWNKIKTRPSEFARKAYLESAPDKTMVLLSPHISGTEDPVLGLEKYCIDTEHSQGIVISGTITRDDRGSGWRLFRRCDHPLLNMSPLDGKENVIFAHKGGFMAKTTDIPLEDAKQLMFSCYAPRGWDSVTA